MLFQIKKLALAAALALGGVTATDVVPVPQAQAEKEVQRDGGNLKLLRAAALQGRELQREADASSVVPDAKPRDGSSGDAPFVARQLDEHDLKRAQKCELKVEWLHDRVEELEERIDQLYTSEYVTGLQQEHDAEVERLNDRLSFFIHYATNHLTSAEFLWLISVSNEDERAALLGARTDYYAMFEGTDLSTNFLPRGGWYTTSASDLGLSEWRMPENANLSGMFMWATNVPDLSHWTLSAEISDWTLTDEWGLDTNQPIWHSRVYRMFIGVRGMTYGMCPCINHRRCCPSLFGHGDACELKMEEQDECGSQR